MLRSRRTMSRCGQPAFAKPQTQFGLESPSLAFAAPNLEIGNPSNATGCNVSLMRSLAALGTRKSD